MKGFAVGDPRAKAAGQKGGQRAQERQRATIAAWWQAKCPGVPWTTVRALYRLGYGSGWRAGQRHGYRVWKDAQG